MNSARLQSLKMNLIVIEAENVGIGNSGADYVDQALPVKFHVNKLPFEAIEARRHRKQELK